MADEVVFRIDLSQGIHQGTLPDSPENIAYNLNHATIYLPNLSGTFKNGDTITVSALESHKFAGIPGVVSVPQVVGPPGNSFSPGGSGTNTSGGTGTNTSNNGVYTFNTSGNWTSPSGDRFVKIVCFGGGGGGSFLTGGGGGGIATSVVFVKSNTVLSVVVGAGGLAVPGNKGVDAEKGLNGTDSYVQKGLTVLIRAKGGTGGTPEGSGGAGGTVGVGDTTFSGGVGGTGMFISAGIGTSGGGGGGGGHGGSVPGGGGGVDGGGNGGDGATGTGDPFAATPGRNGQIPGGGGGGCVSDNVGSLLNTIGNGAKGQVIITVLGLTNDSYTFTNPNGVSTGYSWTAPLAGTKPYVARLWGGGAAGAPIALSVTGGGGLTAGNSKAGGGGGGYAEKLFTSAQGIVYNVIVGQGGRINSSGQAAGGGASGWESTFSGPALLSTVTAEGGSIAVGLNGGVGGFGSNGDLAYHGGNGGNVSRTVGASTSLGGGGGGSSGGSSHNGHDGNAFTGANSGAGGALLLSDGFGGNGGDGGDNGHAGNAGSSPGGGGGGGGNNAISGNGGDGRIEILYPSL